MLPVETVLSVFPSAVVVGNITLRPLTLAHIAALEVLGVDTRGSLTEAQAVMSAWFLTMSADDVVRRMCNGYDLSGFAEWTAGCGMTAGELLEGVRTVFQQGTVGFVPGKSSDKGTSVSLQSATGGSGYGFPLEIAESFAHEYSCSFDEAMRTPLSRMFGMLACARIRNGGEAGGPDYYERVFANKVRIAKLSAELEALKKESEVGNG